MRAANCQAFPQPLHIIRMFFLCVLIIKGSSREKCVCGLGPLNDKNARERESEITKTKKDASNYIFPYLYPFMFCIPVFLVFVM